jgi:hypothetical protein
MKLTQNQIIAIISYILWWLDTNIMDIFGYVVYILKFITGSKDSSISIKKIGNQHLFYGHYSQKIKTNPLNGWKHTNKTKTQIIQYRYGIRNHFFHA